MNYGEMKLFSILMVPLFVALSFAAAKTTLVQADYSDSSILEIESVAWLLGPSVPSSGLAFEANSAATGSLTITGVDVINIGATSATVVWRTVEPVAGNSRVRYDTETDPLTLEATAPATGTAHSVDLAGLAPDTEYFFKVESTDIDGDPTVDDNLHSFTTDAAAVSQRRAFVGTVMGEPGIAVDGAIVKLIRQGTGEDVIISLLGGHSVKTPGGPRAGKFVGGASVVILAENVGGGL